MPGRHKVTISSKKDKVKLDCPDCEDLKSRRRRYRKKNNGYEQKGKPKYCVSHSCTVLGKNKSPCWKRKNEKDQQCGSHLEPTPTSIVSSPPAPKELDCDVGQCHLSRYHGLPHCELHSCSYSFCSNYADPTHGKVFCDDHKCSMTSCQFLRKISKDGDHIMLAFLCPEHECMTEDCHGAKVPGKNHCQEHCCKVPNCHFAHEPVLDRYCLKHFSQKLKTEGATDKEVEMKTMLEARAKEDAERAQEERDAIERRNREAKERKLQLDKLKLEEDLKEEKRKREQLAAEHERERERGTRVREDKKYHTTRPFVSPRHSGSNFSEKLESNPHVKPTYKDRHHTPSSSPNHEYTTQTTYRNMQNSGTKVHEQGREHVKAENSQQHRNKRWSHETLVDSGLSHDGSGVDDRDQYMTTDSSDSESEDDTYLKPNAAKYRARASSTESTAGSSVGHSAGPAPGSRDEYFRYRPEEERRGDYRHQETTRGTYRKGGDSDRVYNYGHHEKREMERERKAAREKVGESGGRGRERTYNKKENVRDGKYWREL